MAADSDVVDALTRVLIKACRRLAEVGYPEESGRLVADGWLAVRAQHPRQALHLDGAMHHIARLERDSEAAPARAEPPHRPNGPTAAT